MLNLLEEIIIGKIKQKGKIPLDEFIDLCLSHPEYGYYTVCEPFGAEGDFTTAPEISQIFGELIGIWIIICWQNMGMPRELSLIEFGPGRATLMSDILRSFKIAPRILENLSINIVEISDKLTSTQKKKVSENNLNIKWHKNIDEIECENAIIIGNEFLDALSLKQYHYTGSDERFFERFIGLTSDGKFGYIIDTKEDLKVTDKAAFDIISETTKNTKLQDGDIMELSMAREAFIDNLCSKFKGKNIYALFVDYGYRITALGDSLQAVKDHEFVDVFKNVGNADITSHVDFSRILLSAKNNGYKISDTISQRELLEGLGIFERLKILETAKSDKVKNQLRDGVTRLISTDEMGELFKAICFCNKTLTMPPPFMEQTDMV